VTPFNVFKTLLMKTLLIIFGLLLLSLLSLRAQSLRVSYYGETITHYGLKAAYEWPVWSYTKQRNQAQKKLLFAPGLAVYRHPHNHIGLVFSPELTYRRTSRRGGIFEAGIAPAYFRYFLEGTTFEVNDSGELTRVPLAGGNAFLPTVSIGFGKDLSIRRQLPLSWYTRLNLMQQRPYNTSALIRFSLEAGVNIPLKKP
jgi:hypothetical protein